MKVENIKIINPHETIDNCDVLIEDGIIVSIEKKPGEGKHLCIPGFIDIHTHGSGGLDVMDGPEALSDLSAFFASVGTTTFLPTMMTAPWKKIIEILKENTKVKTKGSRIEGFHLEGPFISMQKKGAHDPKYLLSGSIEKMKELIQAGNGKLNKIVLAPESTQNSVIKYLKDNGVNVSIGHSNAHNGDIDDYIDAGISSATHLWNAMSGVENRNPGIVEKMLIYKDIPVELICDFIHVDRETIKLTIDTMSSKKIMAVTDSIRPAGLDDGEYKSGGLTVLKNGLLITLKDGGNIAGGASVLHDQFKNIISMGYSLNDAVKMTSSNQAEHLKVKRGKIESGYDADILIIDKNNYNIKRIIIGGEEWK